MIKWLGVVAFCVCCGAGSLIAQNRLYRIHTGMEDVTGAEFGAAVNLAAQNVKAVGLLFVPDSAAPVQTVIVVTERGPRAPLSAQGRFGDSAWRKSAESCRCALLYMRLDTIRAIDVDTPNEKDLLRNAALGGADALIALLHKLAQESSHPELGAAPVLLWGWSNAASFGTTFAELYPSRTVAFIRYHTHLRGASTDLNVLKHVPALLIAGGKDDTAGSDDAAALFQRGRSAHAPWAFVLEPEATHGESQEIMLDTERQVIHPWIAGVVRQRVAQDGRTLVEVADDAGWCGDVETASVAEGSSMQCASKKDTTSWLPDEASARGWRRLLPSGR